MSSLNPGPEARSCTAVYLSPTLSQLGGSSSYSMLTAGGARAQEEAKKETRNFSYRSTTEGLDAAQQELRQVRWRRR